MLEGFPSKILEFFFSKPSKIPILKEIKLCDNTDNQSINGAGTASHDPSVDQYIITTE